MFTIDENRFSDEVLLHQLCFIVSLVITYLIPPPSHVATIMLPCCHLEALMPPSPPLCCHHHPNAATLLPPYSRHHKAVATTALPCPPPVVSRLDMYLTNVLMYRTMVLLAHPTKVRR